ERLPRLFIPTEFRQTGLMLPLRVRNRLLNQILADGETPLDLRETRQHLLVLLGQPTQLLLLRRRLHRLIAQAVDLRVLVKKFRLQTGERPVRLRLRQESAEKHAADESRGYHHHTQQPQRATIEPA